MDYRKLLELKAPFLIKRFFAYLYIRLTHYELIYESNLSNSNVLFVHFHELVMRKDINYFLMQANKDLGDKHSLLIYKRKFRFSVNFFKGNKFFYDCENIFEGQIKKFKKVVIFFPHSPSGITIQSLCKRNKINTLALQHGYYQYSKKEFDVLSRATKTDTAIIFSSFYKNFFAHCKESFISGDYFIKPISPYYLNKDKSYIFLSILNKGNFHRTLTIINKIFRSPYFINHHPKTSFHLKVLLWLKLKRKPSLNFIEFKKKSIGSNNYFIDTTVWKNIDFKGSSRAFILQNPNDSFKCLDSRGIKELREKAYNKFLYIINNWTMS